MNKKIYLILAIVISLVITVFQSLLINSRNKEEMQIIYIASTNIARQSVITNNSFIEKTIYSKEPVTVLTKDELIGSISITEIEQGEMLTRNDVTKESSSKDFTFLSLKITGDNFNANDFSVNDYANLYFILDLGKFEKYQLDWLQNLLDEEEISFQLEKDVGILIENIQLAYIDKVNQSAQFVSIKTTEPIDRIISFLQQVATYEFIKINK
ncbi:MAG: hypothetical protein KAG94_04355 [Clostridiales bacterium]|nr:hypothetical protein [Clostridiales bacterium]